MLVLLTDQSIWIFLRSFLCGGSTGLYVFGYCIYYYYALTNMSGLLQTSFFFGYMACICYSIFLMLGTGFFLPLCSLSITFMGLLSLISGSISTCGTISRLGMVQLCHRFQRMVWIMSMLQKCPVFQSMICTMGIISWSLMLPASVICQKPNRKNWKKKKVFYWFFGLVEDFAGKSYANLHNLYQYNNGN